MPRLKRGDQVGGNHKVSAASVGKKCTGLAGGKELLVGKTARSIAAGQDGEHDIRAPQLFIQGVHRRHALVGSPWLDGAAAHARHVCAHGRGERGEMRPNVARSQDEHLCINKRSDRP